MTLPFGPLLGSLRAALERRLLGLSADEIRYTIDDVRSEIRATRAELLDEIAKLRSDLERLTATLPPADEEAEEDEEPIAHA